MYKARIFPLVALALIVTADYAFPQTRKCSIKSFVGSVKVRRGEAVTWIDAKPRMFLRERDAVRTFVESEAELETTEGSLLMLKENTTLELSALQGRGDEQTTRVKILNGSLVSNVKKLVTTKSSFDFETPTAVASIRGTVVEFDVSGERTRIKVYEGSVIVTPHGSKDGTELKDNQMASIAKGQKTVQVEKLSEKPPAGTPSPADSGNVPHPDSSSPALPDSGKPRPPDSPDVRQGSLFSDTASGPAAGEAPRVTVVSPADGMAVNPSAPVTVSGSVLPASAVVTVNGKFVTVGSGGSFGITLTAPAKTGEYPVTVIADAGGISQTVVRRLLIKTPGLNLFVIAPAEGRHYSGPIVPVNGIATPGAEVTVTPPGVRVLVLSSGTFSAQAPIPDEEGEHVIEIEAMLDGSTRRISRRVFYEPEFRFLLHSPADGQTVNAQMVPVRGEVHPSKETEITVLGRKLAVSPDGSFNGVVTIPDEEGDVSLEFEISTGGKLRTVTRVIVYKKAVDRFAPVIQGTLPRVAKQKLIGIPVYDRTDDDEITFYWEIDGARESEKRLGSGSFSFNLEEGIHTYSVFAEDRAKNQSQRLTERIAYLESSAWSVKVRKPQTGEVIFLPPPPPESGFEPAYVVECSIENLPADDMRLIREVRISNQQTGEAVTRSAFTDHFLDFEMKLKPGRVNIFVIEVQDINGNRKLLRAPLQLK